jgi:hypothetical protein
MALRFLHAIGTAPQGRPNNVAAAYSPWYA